MPGSTPPTSQLDWLSSTTAMIVLFWSRATRDLLKSFGWGIAALHRLDAATKLPFPRRPPHSISRSLQGIWIVPRANARSAGDLYGDRSAVHMDFRARDVGRLIGSQEQNCICHFVNLSRPAHRDDAHAF